MSQRVARGIALAGLLLVPESARAHTPGLSLADFEVHADGTVAARVTFASGQLLGELALDRDRDGVVTPEEVAEARDDLRTFLLDGVGVDADGSVCAAVFRDGSLTEVDGLVLEASYDCPSDAREIEVTLYYLSAAGRAAPHRGIARIVAGASTTEAILTGDHRAIALQVPGRPHGATRKWLRLVVIVATGAVLALLLWTSRRWRQVRAAWQNRTL